MLQIRPDQCPRRTSPQAKHRCGTSTSVTAEIPDEGVPGGGNKTVNLTLSYAGGGATMGAQETATLWIVE
jgi:hypothetical protein